MLPTVPPVCARSLRLLRGKLQFPSSVPIHSAGDACVQVANSQMLRFNGGYPFASWFFCSNIYYLDSHKTRHKFNLPAAEFSTMSSLLSVSRQLRAAEKSQ